MVSSNFIVELSPLLQDGFQRLSKPTQTQGVQPEPGDTSLDVMVSSHQWLLFCRNRAFLAPEGGDFTQDFDKSSLRSDTTQIVFKRVDVVFQKETDCNFQ